MRSTFTGIVGSNPTLSANQKAPLAGAFFIGGLGEVNEPMFDKSPAGDLGAERSEAIRGA